MNERDPADRDVTLLLKAAKDGCKKSTNELFKQHEEYLMVISNYELDAGLRQKFGESDAVQMAFAKAAAALDDFRGNNSKEFRGWLRTILINEINQARRAFKRQSRDAARERSIDGDSKNHGVGEPENADLTPQSTALREEQIQLVRQAVLMLPEFDQQVIKLRNWERWPFAKIAEHLNKNEEAVKKTWQRAIVKLDQLMRSHESS